MAAAFLLLLLLVASGGAAGGNDEAGRLSYLQLRGIEDSCSGHASDSDAPPQGQGLMDYLKSTHGCGSFAALLGTTANAPDIFREHIVAAAGNGSGLTVFCPSDVAVEAFRPVFSSLSADDQLAVVLCHAAAARYGREQIAAFESVAVRTLAADPATNTSHVLTVRDDGETVWLWPSSSHGSGGAAKVTNEVATSGESPLLAVYVVDAVLLPRHLQQLMDAPPCAARGGYLGWLHYTVPLWGALCLAGAGMVGILAGFFVGAVMAEADDEE